MAAELDATVQLTILTIPFTLTGKFVEADAVSKTSAGIQVGFGKTLPDGTLGPLDFQSAPSLNTALAGLVTEIRRVVGIADPGFDPVGEITNQVSKLPGLTGIVQAIQSADARITLLQIDTVQNIFALGFAVAFPTPLTLGEQNGPFNVQISSFGLTITHTTASAATTTPPVTTTPAPTTTAP